MGASRRGETKAFDSIKLFNIVTKLFMGTNVTL